MPAQMLPRACTFMIFNTLLHSSWSMSAYRQVYQYDTPPSSAFLVESMPIGNCSFPDQTNPLPSTHSTLVQLLDAAQYSLDITAMYWNLLAEQDTDDFTATELAAFGAGRGLQVYRAIERAAARNVSIRILNCAGFQSQAPSPEFQHLLEHYHDTIEVREWNSSHWYQAGIMHAKVWIFDRAHFYVGSANMDWKSLAQVMELGVVVTNAGDLALDMTRVFDVWWTASDTLEFQSMYHSTRVFSSEFQTHRIVPEWSSTLTRSSENPFASSKFHAVYNQSHLFNGKSFLSASPSEMSGLGRTWDQDAIVDTIMTAQKHVSISVMDFQTSSEFPVINGEPHHHHLVWWPAFSRAILTKIFAQRVKIRILLSHWAHSHASMWQNMRALVLQASWCRDNDKCPGELDIRFFQLPGWNATTGDSPQWPGFSRVNHAKYIVTDSRVNVGTSNWSWGYFYTTAGISFNSRHTELRENLQQLFDRNWNSQYAHDLQEIDQYV